MIKKLSPGRFPETRNFFWSNVNTIIFRITNLISSSIVTKMWCDTVALLFLSFIEIFLLPIMQITYFESLYYLYFSWRSTKKTRHMVLFYLWHWFVLCYPLPFVISIFRSQLQFIPLTLDQQVLCLIIFTMYY